jgi:chemotaxis protein MotA
MFAIIGIVVVFGCIVAGYLMEHGNIRVLMQPAELVIIGGASVGTVLIANPLNTLRDIVRGIATTFKASPYTPKRYVDLLTMTFELLNKARKDGLVALESDVEDPKASPLISKYPDFASDHHAVDFFCDTMRVAISGGMETFDLDQMMESDLDIHHHEGTLAPTALYSMADALPGLGIVAAVLGVVITMGSLGGPPEEIGKKVAAALVGTFLGILLCYGLFGPIAQRMSKTAEEQRAFLNVVRVSMVAFLKGIAPMLAVEIGRRAVPVHVRPSFKVVEDACRSLKSSATAAAAAGSEG